MCRPYTRSYDGAGWSDTSSSRRCRNLRSGSCCASARADCVRLARIVQPAQAATEVGACRVCEVVVAQRRRARSASIKASPASGSCAHRQRHGAIERDDRRVIRAQQHVVQPDDLTPVGLRPRRAPQRAPRQSRPAACTGRIGATRSARCTSDAALVRSSPRFQRERSCSSSRISSPRRTCARRARDSCSSINASSPSTSGSGSSSRSSRPSRMASADRVVPRERVAGAGRIALVEHQVDHVQHGVESRAADPAAPAPDTECARRGSSPWRARCAARALMAR